jgi:hypothetical protein
VHVADEGASPVRAHIDADRYDRERLRGLDDLGARVTLERRDRTQPVHHQRAIVGASPHPCHGILRWRLQLRGSSPGTFGWQPVDNLRVKYPNRSQRILDRQTPRRHSPRAAVGEELCLCELDCRDHQRRAATGPGRVSLRGERVEYGHGNLDRRIQTALMERHLRRAGREARLGPHAGADEDQRPRRLIDREPRPATDRPTRPFDPLSRSPVELLLSRTRLPIVLACHADRLTLATRTTDDAEDDRLSIRTESVWRPSPAAASSQSGAELGAGVERDPKPLVGETPMSRRPTSRETSRFVRLSIPSETPP